MGLFSALRRFVVACLSLGDEQKQQKPHYAQQSRPETQEVHYPPSAHQHQQQLQQQQRPHKPHTQPQYQQPQPQPEPARPQHAPKPHQAQSPPRIQSPRIDQNQVNQQNEHYTSLRTRAVNEGDRMAQCFAQSQEAYQRGDGARAKELSNEGKEHQREMERLNQEASEWIFRENNTDSKPGEIDLHGLYVKEAITFTDRAIQEARQRGDSELHLIVGKGLHSKGGVAKLKPAIEELIQKHNLVAELDPQNAGVIIVSLDGRDRGTGRVLRPDDIARGIENKDNGCVIM